MGQSCPCGIQSDPQHKSNRPSKNTIRLVNEQFAGGEGLSSESERHESDVDENEGEENSIPLDEQDMHFTVPVEDISKREMIYKCWREALLDGNTALLEWYTQEHPELNFINYEFPEGCSSLSKAIQCKLYSVVHSLLLKGADANHVNEKTGNTPLHEAVLVDNPKLVIYLVREKQVDVMTKNKDGKTPYDLAIQTNNSDIAELLEPELTAAVTRPMNSKSILEELSNLFGENNGATNEKDDIFKETSNSSQTKGNANSNGVDISVMSSAQVDVMYPLTTENGFERDSNALNVDRGYYKQPENSAKLKVGSDNLNHRPKNNSTRIALEQMESIRQEQARLPVLQAFLKKKQPRAPYAWQKRWVVVKHGHMLWSDKQREIADASNSQERSKFNGQFSIMHIVEWGPIETRSNNKFYLIASTDKATQRRFEFKAVSEQDRNFWLKGIQTHIGHEKKMIQYLGQHS